MARKLARKSPAKRKAPAVKKKLPGKKVVKRPDKSVSKKVAAKKKATKTLSRKVTKAKSRSAAPSRKAPATGAVTKKTTKGKAVRKPTGVSKLPVAASMPKTSARPASRPRKIKPAPRANVSHPGMMGDGTEEQNLNQTGNPEARITKEEVDTAFNPPERDRE